MAQKTSPKVDAIRAQLPKRERRFVPGADSAVEMRDDAGTPKIAMSIPFNRRSVELWGFTEVIEPGAFRKTLQEADVVCLWQHDPSWVLGRMSNKTLEARETDTALEGVVALDAEDPMHKHFARRVERRDVVGSSFGFETVRDEWDYSDENQIIRTLKEVRLFDISPVTFPAYPDSDAQKRASSVLDIASVRAGVDIAVLAAAIAAAEDGRIPSEAAERVRSCVDKIVAMLPPPPTSQMSDDERRQRLNLFGKLAGR
jgi:HK97 family phage prohead protease